MKASELIVELQKSIDQHGDLRVVLDGYDEEHRDTQRIVLEKDSDGELCFWIPPYMHVVWKDRAGETEFELAATGEKAKEKDF